MDKLSQLNLPPWGRYQPVITGNDKYDEEYRKDIVSKVRNILYTLDKSDYPDFEYCRLYDQRIRDYMPGIIVKGYPSTKWSYVQKQMKEKYDVETMPVSIEEDTDEGRISEYLIYMSPLDKWEKKYDVWKELASTKKIDPFDEYSVYPKWQGRRPTLGIDEMTPYDKLRKNQLTALVEDKLGYDIESRYCRMYDASEEYVSGLIVAKTDEQWDDVLRELEEKYHVTSTEIESKGSKFIYLSPFYDWEDAEFWLTIREEVENL